MDIMTSVTQETYGGDLDSTDDPGPTCSQSGGNFINAGTYGCAFSPPLKCTDASKNPAPSTSKYIGKVFSKTSSMSDELKELQKIKLFDPTFLFTVPYVNHCIVHKKNFKASDEVIKCTRHIKPTQLLYPQLISNYGGIDLNNLYTHPSKYPFEMDELIRLCLPVFEGIQRMGAQELAHVDIKPPNMLLNLDVTPPKVYLIDFGLLTKFKDLKTQFYLHEHRYPYYPPEFKIYTHHRKGIYDTRVIFQSCIDNFAYFNSNQFFRWISKRWPNYLRDLQMAIQSMQTTKFGDFVKDFDSEIAPRVDSYGIAMTLIELIYRLEIITPSHLKVKNKAFFDECMQTILFPMIHPNVYSRIPIDLAIVLLQDLMAKYPTVPVPPKKTVPPPPPQKSSSSSPSSPTKPSPLTMEQCQKFRLVDLQEYLSKHNLPKYGKKEVLCQRLIKAINDKHTEHKSAKRILKEAIKRDKKQPRGPVPGPGPTNIPPPQNDVQREIDRLYRKSLADCQQTDKKGGYTITELREIARQLRLTHTKKKDEICKELQNLRIPKP